MESHYDMQECGSEKAPLIKSEIDGDSYCPPSTLGNPHGSPLPLEGGTEYIGPRRSRAPCTVFAYGVMMLQVVLGSWCGLKYL